MNQRKKVVTGAVGAVMAGALAVSAFAMAQDARAGKGGVLDDGKDLLPKASISLDQAIAAAQTAAAGEVDEVDLEYWRGTLVFNVDVGNSDVKVDASTGAVLGQESDD